MLHTHVSTLYYDDSATDRGEGTEEDEEEKDGLGMELAVAGSAHTGEGMIDLLKALDETLRSIMVSVEVLLPYSEASTLSQIHDRGSCDKVIYQSDGTFVAAKVPQDLAIRLLPFRVDRGSQSYNLVQEGEEIDWAALAKGRHYYKEKLERGEPSSSSSSSSNNSSNSNKNDHNDDAGSSSSSYNSSGNGSSSSYIKYSKIKKY
ncbi:gtp-binding protein [Nannochloropsis oceanica]